MTGLPESVLAEIDRAAGELVASFPPFTGEELAEISRLFAGTSTSGPSSAGGSTGRVGVKQPAARVSLDARAAGLTAASTTNQP